MKVHEVIWAGSVLALIALLAPSIGPIGYAISALSGLLLVIVLILGAAELVTPRSGSKSR